MNKTYLLQLLKRLSYIVIIPIKKELPFTISIVILLICPTLLDTFYIEYEGSSFWHIITYNKNGAGIPYITFAPFFIAYTCAIISLAIKGKKSYYFKTAVYTIVMVLFLTNTFLLLNFGTMINPTILTLIIETNSNESKEFMYSFLTTKETIVTIIITTSIILSIIVLEKKKNKLNIIFNKYTHFPFFIIICYLLFRSIQTVYSFTTMYRCQSIGEIEKWASDFQVNTNTISATLYSLYDLKISQKELYNIIKHTQTAYSSYAQCTNTDFIDIILVIGESYSKYHCQLYDYEIKNTPYLMKQKELGNLFVFSNVITPYNLTSFAIKNMLSTNDLSKGQKWTDYPLFPSIFKKAGYKVYFWDNQMDKLKGGASDFSLNGIIHNSKISNISYDYTNDRKYVYDEGLIESFKQSYKGMGKNLIIIHLMGQHIVTSERYPHDSFEKFTSQNINKKNLSQKQRQTIAEYENATLYNDYILNSIIEYFKNHNSILIYLSDHGEEVYDYRNVIGRTHEKMKTKQALKYQYEIPFMIWCSEEYKRTNGDILNQIKNSSNTPYMSDKLPHLLFHIANIRTDYYQPKSDILSPTYKFQKRIVQDDIEYDN